jgi:very-short-patch-repair endonuclease
VLSRAQALDCGISRRQIDRLLADGTWLRERPGVYRLHAVVPTPEASLRAASLWLGAEAVLTGVGAAWWWRCLPEAPGRWSFSVSSAACPPRALGLTVRRAFVDPIDRTTRWEVPVLARPFAVLQAAVVLEQQRPGQGITLIDRAKQQRRVSEVDLERTFLRHRGTWGSLAMRRLLDRTGDRAHSELERLAVRLLRAAGITGFVVNYRTVLPGGRPVELDVAFVERRVALELDGWAYHAGPEAHRTDVRRANDIMAAGWTVRRFTWSDLLADPDGFVATVREVLAI